MCGFLCWLHTHAAAQRTLADHPLPGVTLGTLGEGEALPRQVRQRSRRGSACAVRLGSEGLKPERQTQQAMATSGSAGGCAAQDSVALQAWRGSCRMMPASTASSPCTTHPCCACWPRCWGTGAAPCCVPPRQACSRPTSSSSPTGCAGPGERPACCRRCQCAALRCAALRVLDACTTVHVEMSTTGRQGFGSRFQARLRCGAAWRHGSARQR